MAAPGQRLAEHIRAESARVAEICTSCGACVQACPMLAYAQAASAVEPGAVAAGVLDVLRDGPGTLEALAWIAACTRSSACTPACPEPMDPAQMMRLAGMRARGALGEAARLPVKSDPGWSARVKAFARLTMTEEEQAKWL
jgi:Fe-S oxidoreductase